MKRPRSTSAHSVHPTNSLHHSCPIHDVNALTFSFIQLSLNLPSNHHHTRRALAVDYGARRVGLAISAGYSVRILVPIQHNRRPETVAENVAKVAYGEFVESVVVGLPLTGVGDDGDEGEQARRTRMFVRILRGLWKGDIWLVDERESSKEAREGTGVKSWMQVDGRAAGVILERFFDGAGVVEKIRGVDMVGGKEQVEVGSGDVGEGVGREGWAEWKKRMQNEVRKIQDDAKR